MRFGKYFRIPEGPVDIDQLWHDGTVLNGSQRPVWVSPDDAPGYRYIGNASWPQPPAQAREGYFAEINELRGAGIIVDQAPSGLCDHRFYLRAPTGPWNSDAVFAIGIYSGNSPLDLKLDPQAHNPVITQNDVTDIPASFVADPFMIRVDRVWYLFFEIMHAKSGAGEIGVATSTDTRKWSYQGVVLREPFHLSYPYAFECNGELYMVPESYQAREVRLYRASDFPRRWKHIQTLLRAPFIVDPSVFRHADQWWLLADTSKEMNNQTLSLYHSTDLFGPWREHPRSPVADGDAQIARPAGRVIVSGGRIYRFAQSSVPYYGSDVRAFEITKLTPTEYEERPVNPLPMLRGTGKGWNACGMHHVDAHQVESGKWIACVDGWTSDSVLHQMQR